MNRWRTIWIFALLVTLWSALVPQAAASWECEGRTCGTALLCCCMGPDAARDANCRTDAAPSQATGTSDCPASCNCVLAVQTPETARPAAGIAAPLLHVALLPQAPGLVGPLPSEVVARSIEPRGPPAPHTCLSTPVLRGPPALTLSTIGT